jgi:homogentisate 1,2-dioxygenase
VIEPGSADFADLVQAVTAFVTMPGRWTALPHEVRNIAFQEAIWRELAHISAGQSLSRAALVAGSS